MKQKAESFHGAVHRSAKAVRGRNPDGRRVVRISARHAKNTITIILGDDSRRDALLRNDAGADQHYGDPAEPVPAAGLCVMFPR